MIIQKKIIYSIMTYSNKSTHFNWLIHHVEFKLNESSETTFDIVILIPTNIGKCFHNHILYKFICAPFNIQIFRYVSTSFARRLRLAHNW